MDSPTSEGHRSWSKSHLHLHGGGSRRKKRLVWISLLAVLAVVLATIGASIALEKAECVLGTEVYSLKTPSPVAFLNRPYLGNATVMYSGDPGPEFVFDSGSLQEESWPERATGSSNYAAGGSPPAGIWTLIQVATTFNWSVYTTENMTTTTTSSVAACTSAFVAMVHPTVPACCGVGSTEVSLPSNTTDVNEPNYLPDTWGPASQVWFDNGFHGSNYPTVDTCGLNHSITINVSSRVHVPIGLTFPFDGHNVTVRGSLSWDMQGFQSSPTPYPLSYTFPSGAGQWQVYSPSGTDLPGALAFQYSPC